MNLSRRTFLGGAAGAAAIGTGAWAALIRDGIHQAAPIISNPTTTVGPVSSTTVAAAQAAAGTGGGIAVSDRVLVVLEMAGGNDALNTLVSSSGGYHDARPLIGLDAAEVLPLSGSEFGLHPALAGIVPFWEAGTMSAVAGVGIADQSRSCLLYTSDAADE